MLILFLPIETLYLTHAFNSQEWQHCNSMCEKGGIIFLFIALKMMLLRNLSITLSQKKHWSEYERQCSVMTFLLKWI